MISSPPMLALLLTVCCVAIAAPAQEPPEPQAPQAMATPRALVFTRGEARIVVDGTLQDWPAVPAIRLDDTRQLSGTALGAYHGPNDLNAQAFLLWDEESLFFAAKVLDDRHLHLTAETPRQTEIPPTDAIVLTFDPQRDTRAIGADPGRSEDSSFWLGDSDSSDGSVIRWDRLRGTARIARGARSAVTREDDAGLTTYEARIPWSEILPGRAKAEVGDLLDLQIVVNDYDVPLDPMPDTRIGWTFGTGPRIDPGLFGSIRLSSRVGGTRDSFEVPEFPSPPTIPEDPVPGRAYWVSMQQRLHELPPAWVDGDTPDPGFAGGPQRREWLETLDGHLEAFPRADYLRLHMCVNRRMVRECAGMIATGLPFYFDHVLREVERGAAQDSPARGFRLVRLPQGGWLVRSKTASFLIDPSGFSLEKRLWKWCDFALLTAPNEVTKRNDQLYIRMGATKPPRRPFMHIAQALPMLDPAQIVVAKPGETYTQCGLKLTVMGSVDERGWVTSSVGYHVEWPDGSTLIVGGTDALAEQAPKDKPDVLVLSVKQANAVPFGHRLQPRAIVLEDVLQCSNRPGPAGRTPIEDVFKLQGQLRPFRSILLAPGESIESETERK